MGPRNATDPSVRQWGLGDPDAPILRWTLRIVGVVWTLFFVCIVPAMIWTDVGMESRPIGKLSAWGDGGIEYVVMIAALNIGLGIYLVISAQDPTKYRYAIDVFLVCETLHMVSMAIMALVPSHHMHLLGDVFFGVLPVLAVAAVWLPARRRAFQAAT